MTWIKICGITNAADAQIAVSLGVDALGFIFAPSKRYVQPEKVREIVACLPKSVDKIGVFLDSEEEKVQKIARFCGLSGLQFHGQESPEYCKGFNGFEVIKTFRVNAIKGWDKFSPYLKDRAIDKILLDTFIPGKPGGTGFPFPWKLAADQNWKGIPVIVAGGITPENARQAIKEAHPFGIDVSSGVEKKPGKKDENKLKQLVNTVRGGY